MLLTTLSLLTLSCTVETSSQYVYQALKKTNDGFDTGTLDEVNMDAKLQEKAINKTQHGN